MLGINIDFATLSIRIWRPLRSQMEVGMFGKNKIFSGKGRGMTYDLMAHWIGKLIAKRKKLEKKLGARKNIATYCLEVKNYNFPFYCLAT